MARCPHCGSVIDLNPNDSRGNLHSECEVRDRQVRGRERPLFDGVGEFVKPPEQVAESDNLKPIARFMSIAEAGYFSHELKRIEKIDAVVTADEHFDAASGNWTTAYLLSVPESMADSTSLTLERLVDTTDETGFSEFGYEDESGSTDGNPEVAPREFAADAQSWSGCEMEEIPFEDGGINWVPIVLTLAAGSFAFWGMRKLNEKPKADVPAGMQEFELWEQLGKSRRPWVQQFGDGHGIRELQFDDDGKVAIIREDADGDGLFETESPIRRVNRRIENR